MAGLLAFGQELPLICSALQAHVSIFITWTHHIALHVCQDLPSVLSGG